MSVCLIISLKYVKMGFNFREKEEDEVFPELVYP